MPDSAHSVFIISERKEKVEQLETPTLDMLGEEAGVTEKGTETEPSTVHSFASFKITVAKEYFVKVVIN